MIELRKLKELVRLMKTADLIEIDLSDQDGHVTLRRSDPSAGQPVYAAAPVPASAAASAPQAAAATPGSSAPPSSESGAGDATAGLVKIESPMVGTFYAAPNPDSPAFVSVGSNVGAESVVCMIEAMKIFNEIKAECSGTIEKVLVKNGEAVEFGQTLFLVKPS